jgi:RimJ/RimL family protein N-acetyltransferase
LKILETERLVLRTIGVDDAPFYLELVNDPAFHEFIGDRGIRTVQAAIDAIEKGPIAMQATLGHSIYLVELKGSSTPVGMSGLIKRDTLADVDIGYAFLPQFRGKGYAYEAAVAVVAHARDQVRLARLVAITAPGNADSISLLTRLGLQFEAQVHLTADDPGTNLYAIKLA